MLKSQIKNGVVYTGLSAIALFAFVACAGKGSSAPGAPPSTFVPLNIKASANTKENFSTPNGGIITVEARSYEFSDEKGVGQQPNAVKLKMAGTGPVGQDLTSVGEAKYVGTDFCADYKAEDPKACSYLAVVLNRTVADKNETRSFLFKNTPEGFQLVCSRDQAYPDSQQTYEALRKECDPAPAATPTPVPTPAETQTPAPTPGDSPL